MNEQMQIILALATPVSTLIASFFGVVMAQKFVTWRVERLEECAKATDKVLANQGERILNIEIKGGYTRE